jgi:hypothetical protein
LVSPVFSCVFVCVSRYVQYSKIPVVFFPTAKQ